MQSVNHTYSDSKEVTLKELFEALRNARRRIAYIAIGCTFLAIVAAKLTDKQYEAIVMISPVSASNGQMGGLGSLASQFGGLASLAGISVSADSKKAESGATLQSEALTERYIEMNNLLPVLYKSQWDSQAMRWKETDPKKVPTLWKANLYFKKQIRKVTFDIRTGLVSLTITWKDPQQAAKWANDLVSMTNAYLKNKAIEESERNVTYLNEQAAKTVDVEAKQAIYRILQSEVNKIMLARGSDEYAFKIIDPAVPPEKATSPIVAIWALVGLFTSVFITVLVTFIRLACNRP
jgi:uncharacterized protein involved in exopolysaccharide biosynthesis